MFNSGKWAVYVRLALDDSHTVLDSITRVENGSAAENVGRQHEFGVHLRSIE